MSERRRQGVRPVETVTDVEIEWLDGDPPKIDKRSYHSHQHERIAALLRSRPNVWARLPQLSGTTPTRAFGGSLRAYRPGGSFEAVVRDGEVYARYIGQPFNGHVALRDYPP